MKKFSEDEIKRFKDIIKEVKEDPLTDEKEIDETIDFLQTIQASLGMGHAEGDFETFRHFQRAIQLLNYRKPSAEWIYEYTERSDYGRFHICSKCGGLDRDTPKFCSNCGRRMKEGCRSRRGGED